MSASLPISRVVHPVAEQTVDGGYSGDVTVTRARAGDPSLNPDLIFIEAELSGRLVLSLEEARGLAEALTEVCEVLA